MLSESWKIEGLQLGHSLDILEVSCCDLMLIITTVVGYKTGTEIWVWETQQQFEY